MRMPTPTTCEVMRQYYRAFMKQDKRIKNYEPYFPSILCYLEGWLEYASSGGKLDDPFESERHALEFSTWQDLMDTVRARIMAGEKSHLENAAYLPQLVVRTSGRARAVASSVRT